MPQPTPSDLYVDQLLTTVSVAYIQSGIWVAERIFPRIPVQLQTSLIAKFDKAPWFRRAAKPRAMSSESAGGGYTVGTQQYACEVYALHKDVDDRSRANAVSPFSPDRNGTQWVTQQLLLEREYAFFNAFFKTGVWGSEWQGNTSASNHGAGTFKQWDQSSGTTPSADVTAACTAVQKICGFRPNKGLISREVFDILKNHSEVKDQYKYTSSESITPAMIARMFELEELLIAEAVMDSSAEGAAADMDFIAGKHMLLAFANPQPDLETVSAGYIPTWEGYLGASAYGSRMSKFRMEELRSDRIEGEMAYQMLPVCTDAAMFLKDCIG